MNLLTAPLCERLLANATASRVAQENDLPAPDPRPVVKFFHPLSAATWLASELDADADTLFGLADLGHGFPELGYFSLAELTSVRVGGVRIERDLFFAPRFPLSVYAEAARRAQRIVDDIEPLRAAAQALGLDPDPPISPAKGG